MAGCVTLGIGPRRCISLYMCIREPWADDADQVSRSFVVYERESGNSGKLCAALLTIMGAVFFRKLCANYVRHLPGYLLHCWYVNTKIILQIYSHRLQKRLLSARLIETITLRQFVKKLLLLCFEEWLRYEFERPSPVRKLKRAQRYWAKRVRYGVRTWLYT